MTGEDKSFENLGFFVQRVGGFVQVDVKLYSVKMSDKKMAMKVMTSQKCPSIKWPIGNNVQIKNAQ